MKTWVNFLGFAPIAVAVSSSNSLPAPSSTGSTAVCLQPRQSSVPSATAIGSALASAIPSACSTANQQTDNTSSSIITNFYQLDSINFNISHNVGSTPTPPASDCPDSFQGIISTCVSSLQQNGFWGGWVVKAGLNYSISDFGYPANGLLNLSRVPSTASATESTVPVGGSTSVSSGSASSPISGSQLRSSSPSVSATTSRTPNSGTAPPTTGSSSVASGSSTVTPPGTGNSSAPSASNSGAPPSLRTSSLASVISSSVIPPLGPGSSSGSDSATGSVNGSASPSTGGQPASSALGSGSSQPAATSSQTRDNGPGSTSQNPPNASNSGSVSNPASSAPTSIPIISPVSTGSDEIYQLASGIVATGNPSDIIVAGQTLTPGGTPYTSGTNTIALETGGVVEINGSPEQLGTPGPQSPLSVSSSSSATQTVPNSDSGSTTGSNQSLGTSTSGQTSSGGSTPGQTSNSGPSQTTVPPIASTSGGIATNLITGTVTSAPPEFSTQKVSNTEWTGNTYITTEQDGHSTIVPVIVGCPNCGGLHGGIILWGLPPIPDVSFQFPKFPDLPHIHLPCIKIFGVTVSGDCDAPPQDDNPSDEDQDTTDSNPSSTKASSTRSKSTTASITTSSSSGSFSSSSSPSSSSSVSGCYESLLPSASGVAKRGVSDSVPSDSCPYTCPATLPQAPTTGPLAVAMPTADPGDVEKRALAGRIPHVIDKRGKAKSIDKINNCVLTTPAGSPVTTPAYPGGYEFWTSETNGVLPASYQALSRYYRTTRAGCLPTITKVPAAQVRPQQNSGDINEENSVDHAYENGWLTAFMESITNNGGSSLSCNDLNDIFFGNPRTCNFLEPVFGALASATNPDFVVMSQFLNGNAKGLILGANYQTPPDLQNQYVVGPTWSWADARDNINFKLGTLNNHVLGCLMVSEPNLIDLIQKTNNRIYHIFQLIDASHASDPSLPRQGFGFAQQYKDFMNNFANQWNQVPGFVQSLITNVGNDLQQALKLNGMVMSEWQPMFQQYANYKVFYGPGAGNGPNWQYQISLTFDTSNTKRDFDLMKRVGSCALQSGSGGLSSSGALSTGALTPASSTGAAPSSTKGTITPRSTPASITSQASTTPASSSSSTTGTPCPDNGVDENPPGCIQTTSSSVPFSCSAGSNLGLATYQPATWCGCNTGTDVYPTMTTGTGNAACAYTAPPSTTVKPSVVTICPNNPVDENPPNCGQPSSTSAPFSCSAGSNIGVAVFVPATWCGCNTGPMTNLYPTLTTGTGNAACAYTALPSSTVHPTQATAIP